jgi:glycolate oxidase
MRATGSSAERLATRAALVTARRLLPVLREVCGAEHVLTAADTLRTYESDGLGRRGTPPPVAVLPGSAEEVSGVLRACHEQGVPWVARGAGTGLSGGASPHSEGVLVVLTRLRRILEVDLDNGRVLVEPGVTNVEVGAAVGPSHLYPPDPSSQIVCSIGGNVAENSGGPRCFKYGFTTNYVTGLEVVLASGEIVELGGREVDRPGYDLLGAFVGSEGTLGIATKIWLRIVPAPEATVTVLAFFDSVAAAGEVVSEVVASGIVPAAIELMDALALEATREISAKQAPEGAQAALIVELDGPREECEARLAAVLALLERAGARAVHRAEDPTERARIWRGRKAAFAAMGRISPSYYVQDGVVPRTRLVEVLDEVARLSAEYGMRVANVFHAGDGNLHPLVCYDDSVPGEAGRAEELATRILEACVSRGGSITGEHGVGSDKKRFMPLMFDPPDLDLFHRLRCSFDPAGLANPGKVMPTPRLCGEVPGPYRAHPLERDGVIERI